MIVLWFHAAVAAGLGRVAGLELVRSEPGAATCPGQRVGFSLDVVRPDGDRDRVGVAVPWEAVTLGATGGTIDVDGETAWLWVSPEPATTWMRSASVTVSMPRRFGTVAGANFAVRYDCAYQLSLQGLNGANGAPGAVGVAGAEGAGPVRAGADGADGSDGRPGAAGGVGDAVVVTLAAVVGHGELVYVEVVGKTSGQLHGYLLDVAAGLLRVDVSGGDGGAGGDGAPGGAGGPGGAGEPIGSGGDGADGGDGGRGGDGGDAGTFTVVLDPEAARGLGVIELVAAPGIGGSAGTAGRAGAAGPGLPSGRVGQPGALGDFDGNAGEISPDPVLRYVDTPAWDGFGRGVAGTP